MITMRMTMMLAITVIHMNINLPVAVVERCCLGPTRNQLAALAI